MNTPLSKIPPLENGDRLSRSEFERRYAAAPQIHKAELIEGIVYLETSVRFPHAEAHANLAGWLGIYRTFTSGTQTLISNSTRLDFDNEFLPDGLLLISQSGATSTSVDGFLEGSPELIIEIAESSASIDAGAKKRVYLRNGVQEYIIWQIYENQLSWYELIDGDYKLILSDDQGIMKSRVFPGLWLNLNALLARNMKAVLDIIQAGVKSPEHQAFVESLQ